MDLVWENDKSFVRTIPHGLVVVAKRVPREYAVLVGQQQTVYAKVATYGQTTIVVSQTRIGEPEFVVKLVDHRFFIFC